MIVVATEIYQMNELIFSEIKNIIQSMTSVVEYWVSAISVTSAFLYLSKDQNFLVTITQIST